MTKELEQAKNDHDAAYHAAEDQHDLASHNAYTLYAVTMNEIDEALTAACLEADDVLDEFLSATEIYSQYDWTPTT